MIDEAFVHRLQELRQSGDREAFKTEFTLNGGWERVLDLAEIGAANIKRKRKPRPETPKDEPAGFAEFYSAFPNHVARAAAAKAYGRALKIAKPETILAGAIRYAAECQDTEKRFIKHPATWLNGGCWADEISTARPNLRLVSGGGSWDAGDE